MNKLVLHHSYAHGIAFDLSNNRNHGTPMSVTPGTGSLAPSFEFTDPDSRINVAPSPTLMDLRAIRAIAAEIASKGGVMTPATFPTLTWHFFDANLSGANMATGAAVMLGAGAAGQQKQNSGQ